MMDILILQLVLTVGCCVTVAATEGNLSCLLWNECKCKNVLDGAITCYNGQAYLRVDYGLYNIDHNTTVGLIVALNRYAYHNYSDIPIHLRVYTRIDNLQKDLMCRGNNRKGYLCGKCRSNYGPSAYSPKCCKCNLPVASAIARYLTIKLLPVAILFLVIMTFRINLTNGPMLGYILFCQLHAILARGVAAMYKTLVIQPRGNITNVFLFFSAIWNLDFLEVTSIIPPFCISDKLWDFDVLLLNFISVLFPLFLLVITYVLIELHARDFKLVVYCWKPFHPCFVNIRKRWSTSDSVIHAFASLMFLSFTSLSFNAYQLLSSTNVYRVNDSEPVHKNVLYNHPGIHVFTPKYIYYPITAVVLLFFLGILPSLLLILYPIRLFRERLQRCCSQRFVVTLNTFVETFQGAFKDGSNGTRDLRMVPGILSCLILSLTIFSCLPLGNGYRNYFFATFLVGLALLSVLSAYIRPCKSSIANLSLTFHFMVMAFGALLVTFWMQNMNMNTTVLVNIFVIVVPSPHVMIFIWLCYRVEKKLHLLQRSLACFNVLFGCSVCRKQPYFENSPLLPDRLLHSQEYRELS